MAQILFPLFNEVIFAPIHSARATPMSELLAAAETVGVPARVASSVPEALAFAEAHSSLIVIGGSVYLVGEARPLLLARARS
jgi:dihydrofolate synthase/folylpolyglutamate synthase